MIYAYIYETRVYNRLFLTMNAAGYFGTSLTSLSLSALFQLWTFRTVSYEVIITKLLALGPNGSLHDRFQTTVITVFIKGLLLAQFLWSIPNWNGRSTANRIIERRFYSRVSFNTSLIIFIYLFAVNWVQSMKWTELIINTYIFCVSSINIIELLNGVLQSSFFWYEFSYIYLLICC